MWVLILPTTFVWNISHCEKKRAKYDKEMYVALRVRYPLLLSDLMKLQFSRQIFEKHSNTKLHENPSSRSRVVPRGRTDRQNEDYSRFRTFSNAPKNKELNDYNTFWINCYIIL